MKTTTTTIAIATAAGLLAVGVAGAAQGASSAESGSPAPDTTSSAANKATAAKVKAARQAALRRELKTLPGGKRLPLNKFHVGAGWGHSSGPHAGRHHDGFDFAARAGSPIYSVTDGKVVLARSYYGYGNLVIVKTPSGTRVLYAHQSAIKVKRGQNVKVGQLLGKVGSTGHSTGPHLHLEARTAKDKAFDPQKLLGVSKTNLNKRAHQLNRLS